MCRDNGVEKHVHKLARSDLGFGEYMYARLGLELMSCHLAPPNLKTINEL